MLAHNMASLPQKRRYQTDWAANPSLARLPARLPPPSPPAHPPHLPVPHLPRRRELHRHRHRQSATTFLAAPVATAAAKVRMRQQGHGQGQYGDADNYSMVSAQLHHYQAQQRVQQLPDNSYAGRDPGQAAGENQYTAQKVRQSQWDKGGSNQISPYPYNEGQGAEGTRSFYDGQKSDLKVGIEKQPRKEMRDQPRTDNIEARHEDYNLPRTFEGLEQIFREDIVVLSKELHDAEDAENTRHRERLNEINAQYHEKLLALRARQTAYREEFLRKESLERQQQYQKASMSNYANNVVPREPRGYPPTAAATPPAPAASPAGGTYGEAHRGYASGRYESFGERPDYPEFHAGGQGRGHGFEQRGEYPGGRAYNSGGRRF